MGHLDITRFIIFIQHFVRTPLTNPWDYNPGYPHSDFPYPPLLLYLHALPFFAFNWLITHSPPLDPIGFSYTIFRIPLVLFDLWWLKELLGLETEKNLRVLRGVILSYLLCTVILFHQYYSGQLDLIAVVPFLVSCLEIEKTGKFKLKSFVLLTLSLCLKPFALIFLPFIFLRTIDIPRTTIFKKIKILVKDSAHLLVPVVIFKLSELPFLLTESYQGKMGAGAKVFFEHNALLGAQVFPWAYLFYLAFFTKEVLLHQKRCNLFFHLLMVTLIIGATTRHSAGWMLWGCAGYFLLRLQLSSQALTFWWRLWSFLFVVRWGIVPHSPIADSFGIFFNKFLHLKAQMPMGYVFQMATKTMGLEFAASASHLAEVLFAVSSFCFGISVLRKVRSETTFLDNRTSIP